MNTPDTSASAAPPPRPALRWVARHAPTVRITHWLNVLCFLFLLMSGLQIFNAHPRLYWGAYGADADHAVLSIGSETRDGATRGLLRIGPVALTMSGLLGTSREGEGISERAFPAWATLPSYQDLAAGRQWHLFFAWLFVFNGLVYMAHGLARGHFARDLLPSRDQLSPRHVWHEVLAHARLRFPKGEAARRYNALQKMSYLLVLVLLPLMVLTGLTMSPAIDAAFPWLPGLFGGRQSARTLHFLAAGSLVLFVAVHLLMVVASGTWNNLRSMVTGRYAIETSGDR